MTRYACFRICRRGVDYLGTIAAESEDEARREAERRWENDPNDEERIEVEVEVDEEDET